MSTRDRVVSTKSEFLNRFRNISNLNLALKEKLYKKAYNARFTAAERHAIEMYFLRQCRANGITGSLPELLGHHLPNGTWGATHHAPTSKSQAQGPPWWRSIGSTGSSNKAKMYQIATSQNRDTVCSQLKANFRAPPDGGPWRHLAYDDRSFEITPANHKAAKTRKAARERLARKRQEKENSNSSGIGVMDTLRGVLMTTNHRRIVKKDKVPYDVFSLAQYIHDAEGRKIPPRVPRWKWPHTGKPISVASRAAIKQRAKDLGWTPT